jgi:hypothetical protein
MRIVSKPAHGSHAANALMRAMPIVVVHPMIEHGGSIIGVLVDKTIRPFPQRRLDKALRFPVGLGTVWPGES